jgi:hypothetical protein
MVQCIPGKPSLECTGHRTLPEEGVFLMMFGQPATRRVQKGIREVRKWQNGSNEFIILLIEEKVMSMSQCPKVTGTH